MTFGLAAAEFLVTASWSRAELKEDDEEEMSSSELAEKNSESSAESVSASGAAMLGFLPMESDLAVRERKSGVPVSPDLPDEGKRRSERLRGLTPAGRDNPLQAEAPLEE